MKTSKPTRKIGDMHSDYVETHPSFGMMIINRSTSSVGVPLFGSSLQHKELITIEVRMGERHRGLHQDWNHAGDFVVQLEMSPVQFAEAITSFGMGSGVPCTLRAYRGKDGKWVSPPYPDYTNFKNEIKDEFDATAEKVAKTLDDAVTHLQSILTHKTVTKGEVNDVLARVIKARQDIGANMPFVVDQFQEQMEATVGEAKSEIEAFYIRRTTELGLAALKESAESMPVKLLDTDVTPLTRAEFPEE